MSESGHWLNVSENRYPTPCHVRDVQFALICIPSVIAPRCWTSRSPPSGLRNAANTPECTTKLGMFYVHAGRWRRLILVREIKSTSPANFSRSVIRPTHEAASFGIRERQNVPRQWNLFADTGGRWLWASIAMSIATHTHGIGEIE